MIKTHPRSIIYRISECDLYDCEDIVLQVEHLPNNDNRFALCFVEVVKKTDYDEYGLVEKLKHELDQEKNNLEDMENYYTSRLKQKQCEIDLLRSEMHKNETKNQDKEN